MFALGNELQIGQSVVMLVSIDMVDFFFSGKWGGWCCDGIDEETAIFVDAILGDIYPGFKVDRSKMGESMEAWVWGTVGDKQVVVVWENSD